jgi:hypothetical protein
MSNRAPGTPARARTRPLHGKVFLALPAEHSVATHFRSTWLTSSIAALRERGLFDAYVAALPAEHREAVLATVAGSWLAMATAMAHYGACDRLELPTNELLALGVAATRRAQTTNFSFVARLATNIGVTPWTILSQAHRLWASTCTGGGLEIWELGPKEARIDIVGFPLARYRYNRVTIRGIVQTVAERFCTKVYAREISEACNDTDLAFRVSWV